ncbi:MAG: hypothetical protein ACPG4Y_02620 [Chitinophagales bacterium]
MKRFRTFEHIIDDYKLNNVDLIKEELVLPLCHTTSFDVFDRYIANSDYILEAFKGCEYHNNEKVIFMFYGNSAYFPPKDQSDRFDSNLPVTLIYHEIEDIGEIKRMCCFDSGAYLNGRFDLNENGNKEPENTLKDYIKESPDIQDIVAGVKALFENNENYLRSILKPIYNIKDKPHCTCLRTLNTLHSKTSTRYGPQAFTFEVQISQKLNKEPDVLVLPYSEAQDEEAVLSWTEQFKGDIKVRVYDSFSNSVPAAYSQMRNEVFKYNLSLL